MDINFQFTKKRHDFGRQIQFCEQGPIMCDTIATNVLEHKNFILRNPVDEGIQNTKPYSKNVMNTIRVDYSTSGVNHAEGGWPKDINIYDPEATQRYRRKIEKEDPYIHCVMSNAQSIEHYVLQNNAINIYGTYYGELPSMPDLEHVSCRTLNVYRDCEKITRPISSICWQPEGNKFAVSYNDVDYNRISLASSSSYIWDLENPNRPELMLHPPSPIVDLQYNARDHNVLVGGLMNGQVALWDLRVGTECIGITPPHLAHRDLVRSAVFVNAKSGKEFFSSGPDGVCKWWDTRYLEKLIEEIILDTIKLATDEPSIANSHGTSILEFEPTIPTRFMAGTENGFVLSGNRKGKSQMEKLPIKFKAHEGPVWSLERNPAFLKNFLTVGDWTFRVFSEECRESPVLWSPLHRQKVTAGTWSPTRVSLVLLTQWDGRLAVWDLIRKQHEAVLSVQVAREPLLRLKFHEAGSLLACGSQTGNIYMVEMSKSLTASDKNDKSIMTAILDRENKREHILETRLREIRLKMRQAEEGSPVGSTTQLDAIAGDRDLAEATTEYFAAVKKEIALMTH